MQVICMTLLQTQHVREYIYTCIAWGDKMLPEMHRLCMCIYSKQIMSHMWPVLVGLSSLPYTEASASG